MTRVTRSLGVAAALFAATPFLTAQAPGDLIANINLPVAGAGVSVAVDCDGNVYYTLNGDNNLYVMDAQGNLLNTFDTGFDFDEMVYDVARDVFWAQLHASSPTDVYHVTPTGVANFQWTSSSFSIGTFRDGIGLDAGDLSDLTDDEILLSGDVSNTIEFHDVNGGLIRTLTPTNAAGATLGLISGLTVGLGDLLYLGRNGAVEIVRVQKSDGAFLSSFASPGGARDEGLECDPFNFAPTLALWSREFNAPGFCSVIELEDDTCGCGIAEPTPPTCDGPGNQSASVGQELVLNFQGNDLDGDEMTLSANLPAGAVINPAVGSTGFSPFDVTVTWTPDNTQVGNNDIQVCFSDDDQNTTCCDVRVEVAECFLVIGGGAGSGQFDGDGHFFTTQLGNIIESYPVTMANNPLLPLSLFRQAAAAQGSAASIQDKQGRHVLYAQVLMFNPYDFPANPEQWTQPIRVVLSADGSKVVGTTFGHADGEMDIDAELVFDRTTNKRWLHIPFTVEGL